MNESFWSEETLYHILSSAGLYRIVLTGFYRIGWIGSYCIGWIRKHWIYGLAGYWLDGTDGTDGTDGLDGAFLGRRWDGHRLASAGTGAP